MVSSCIFRWGNLWGCGCSDAIEVTDNKRKRSEKQLVDLISELLFIGRENRKVNSLAGALLSVRRLSLN